MTEHVVLIFAYHYPPENAIGGARPFRFSKYLSRLGYSCRVFTAAHQAGRDDPDTQYVPDPFVSNPRRNLAWHLERAVRKGILPSELGTQWSYYASQAARKYLQGHPDARVTIFSTFPPLGAHFAAWQLARHKNLRWIADFRDPLPHEWMDTFANRFQKRVYRWLEDSLVRRADAIIVNTDAAKAGWSKKYPSFESRIHLIWNGFDPDERIQPLLLPPRDYRQLSHVGELYLGRNATPILKSVARLIAGGRLAIGKVRLVLIGPVGQGCLPDAEFICRATNQGWLELLNEQIPQSEARRVAQTSDGLLLLQPQSTVQVPGKLFDYLQIGRPILAFIQPNSPTERILEKSGVAYRCVYPDSTPEMMDDVVASFFDLASAPISPSPWFQAQFNAEYQTQILDDLIHSLHSKPLGHQHRSDCPPPRWSQTAL